MAVIPVVQSRVAVRDAIRRGVRRRSRVVSCRSIDRVRQILLGELVDAVVLDVRAGLADAAFALVKEYPQIPVFAFSAFRPDDGALLTACLDRGVEILVGGVDEPVAGDLIAARSASAIRRRQLGEAPRLLRLTEPVQLRVWNEILERVGGPVRTDGLAGALGITREHLSREFAAGGAPNLKRVIDLARLTTAAALLANPGYNVSTVSGLLGYSSPSHLAGSARRIAGVTPTELGRLGARGVLERFCAGRTRSRL